MYRTLQQSIDSVLSPRLTVTEYLEAIGDEVDSDLPPPDRTHFRKGSVRYFHETLKEGRESGQRTLRAQRQARRIEKEANLF